MDDMEQQPVIPPPPPGGDHCYRHPSVATGVHCTRCNRPICTECMIPAPVGHQCPTCVAEARKEFRQGPGRRVAAANVQRVSVTNAILVILIAVYVLEVARGGLGSFVGGLLVSLLAGDGVELRPSGIIGSIVGAVLVTLAWGYWQGRQEKVT